MRTLLIVACLTACGGPKAEPVNPNEPETAVAWKDMNLDQRAGYMKDVVLPATRKIFAKFDPKFATMDCVTCHGDGVENGDFAMPDAKIKPLPSTPEAFMAWVSKDPEAGRYAKFMSEEVEPLMGKLLDKTVFDPATGKGELSCAACHTLVDAAGKRIEAPKNAEDHAH